jgi:hypothetical protein
MAAPPGVSPPNGALIRILLIKESRPMHDRTALPDADTRALLQQIAARLTAERPQHPMRPSIREALALSFATRRHGYGTDRAARAEELLLAFAPAVESGMTRSRYAAELRQAAGGDQ